VFLALFACCGFGQTFRGSIQGTITDPTGAAVVGAKVKIFNPGTGLSRTVETNDQGGYQTSELPLGTYSVTIEKEGFRTTTLNQIPVGVGSPARADAKLITGEVKELVEVNADVPMVETSSNTTGGMIEATQAAELPINGRDFTKLLELVPGTTSDPMGATESAGSYGLFTLNGNRGRSNNYLLDGTDMNDGYRNLPAINQAGVWGCPGTILPIDALAEIPVTGSPEAEFGRSSGATVNIVTKSGSNEIHGSAFEYFRNDALGARNFFNTTDQAKDSFTNHQFGGSIGGPIVKDKSFWFVAYEGQLENGSLPQLGNVPTQADINAAGGATNLVIQRLLARNPWGVLPASGDGATTFTTPFSNSSNNLIFKIDQHLHLFSPGDLLTGRYFFSKGTQSFPLGMLNTGSSAPGYNVNTPTHVNLVSLSYTSVPKSNVIVELRGGYNRFLQDFFPEDLNSFDPTSIGLDTLPPNEPAKDLARDHGLPLIKIANSNGSYSTIGTGTTASRGRIDTNYQLFGNVSVTKGKHNFKTGYEWRRTFINSFIDSGHRGTLNFNNLSDFLSGTIDGGSSAQGAGTRYTYQNGSGAYIQDSWRLAKHITANYGLRWDYYGVVGEQNHQFSLFDPYNPTTPRQVGVNGGPKTLYPKDFKNFAPRISLVDDVLGNGKMVVRTGVGIFYDGASQDFFVGNQPWNTYAAQAGPAFNSIGFSFSPTATIRSGVPVFDSSTYSPNSVFTVAQNLTTPTYLSYNLNIESQITPKVAVQIGYVGSEGHHLFRFRDLNQVDIVSGTTQSCGNGTSISYGYQCFPALYYVNQVETTANSFYNSLQASLKIQNWHGVTSTLNYTWAHSIDSASDGLDFVPNAAQPDNSFNPHGERASSNFDVRQRLQWFWTYNLPKFETAKWLTNGWAVDGMFNFATGQPYTVTLFEGNWNGSGEYFSRPDIVSNPQVAHSVNPANHGINLLNAAAFAAPCFIDSDGNCSSVHPGSEGRNAFNSTNYTNFDFSLTKLSHLNEKVTMQLRADIFNIFNHPNFGNPLLPNFSVDTFGGGYHTPTQGNFTNRVLGGVDPTLLGSNGKVNGPQYIQTTATPDVANGNPYLGGGGPRTMQLAVRFSF
jgi:hypothetical protein